MSKRMLIAAAAAFLALGLAPAWAQAGPPEQSPRVQAIKKRGALRVGALGEFPWLRENPGTRSSRLPGLPDLANDYAKRLGVS